MITWGVIWPFWHAVAYFIYAFRYDSSVSLVSSASARLALRWSDRKRYISHRRRTSAADTDSWPRSEVVSHVTRDPDIYTVACSYMISRQRDLGVICMCILQGLSFHHYSPTGLLHLTLCWPNRAFPVAGSLLWSGPWNGVFLAMRLFPRVLSDSF